MRLVEVDYKEFTEKELARYEKLKEEPNELYKRNYVPIESKGPNEEDSMESLKVIAKNSGIMFDAMATNRDFESTNRHIKEIKAYDMDFEGISDNGNKYEALAYARASHAIEINIEANEDVSVKLALGSTGDLFLPININVGENARLSLLECFMLDANAIHIPINNIKIGRNSSVSACIFYNPGINTLFAASINAELYGNAAFNPSIIYSGGKRLRSRTRISCNGMHASASANEIAFAEKGQKYDIETMIESSAKETSARIATSAFADNAEAIIKGFAGISSTASDSSSDVDQKGMVIGNGSINFIPGMEIEQGNVKAKHSAAVAPINPDALFYLMARGMSNEMASAAVIKGFFAKPIMEIEDNVAKLFASSLIVSKLEGNSTPCANAASAIWPTWLEKKVV